ncbi:hypothetical protein [Paraburkholderia dipogonis]|uniref:hypothetical protein n=1 Tax=Paraburkholderia dipogonis TaxID=1211383 RepID=UPI0038B73AA9
MAPTCATKCHGGKSTMRQVAQKHARLNSNGESVADVAERSRSQSSEMFHTAHSLKTRVFFDEPARPLECAGFVKAHDPKDRRWLRVGAALVA